MTKRMFHSVRYVEFKNLNFVKSFLPRVTYDAKRVMVLSVRLSVTYTFNK